MSNERLQSKTVIITSGHRGGGASLAFRYAASGANVVIIANKETTNALTNINEISDPIIDIFIPEANYDFLQANK